MSIIQRIRWGRVLLAGAAIMGLTTLFTAGEQSQHSTVEITKPGDDLAYLANRPWVDHMPRNERDMVTRVVFIDKDNKKTERQCGVTKNGLP